MAIEITKLPEYQVAKDEYTAAIAQAKAARDDVGEMRAELAWERAQNRLRDQAQEMAEQSRALEEARAQVKRDYPRVPEELYQDFTDPVRVLAAAQAAQRAIDAAAPAQVTGTGAPTWPQPGQGTPPPAQTDKYDDPQYLADLNRRYHFGTVAEKKAAAEEVQQVTFERQVLPRFSRFHEAQQQSNQR